jgi:hypothetical protein
MGCLIALISDRDLQSFGCCDHAKCHPERYFKSEERPLIRPNCYRKYPQILISKFLLTDISFNKFSQIANNSFAKNTSLFQFSN